MQELRCHVVALLQENTDLKILLTSIGHTITLEDGQKILFQTKFWDNYVNMSQEEKVSFLEQKCQDATALLNEKCLKVHNAKITTFVVGEE